MTRALRAPTLESRDGLMERALKRASDRVKEAAELEAPKLTIDLAKVFGFAPISLEIPIPKLFFSDKSRDPLGLPFRRWKVKRNKGHAPRNRKWRHDIWLTLPT